MIRHITKTDYAFETEPYDHQRDVFLTSRNEENWAYLMEMGTGKTKVAIDNAAYLYEQGLVKFLLIAAPNEVHKNWVEREIPLHMPKRVDYRACVWRSASTMKKADWENYWSLWDADFKGLRILAVNFDAFSASEGRWDRTSKNPNKPFFGYAVKRLMDTLDTMFVVDESSKIKTPGVRRSKRIVNLGAKAKYRRILTGTLGGPLEAYNQFLFLDPDILGFNNFVAYKHRYAEWRRVVTKQTDKYGRRIEFDELVGYRNIEELNQNIDRFSSRILKRDCLDLPEKIYMRRVVAMGPDQQKRYNMLKQRSLLDLRNEKASHPNNVVPVTNILTKYLRLQQIVGGWLPPSEEELFDNPDAPTMCLYKEAKDIPRMKALLDVVEENSNQQVIIWARFRHEIEAITDILNKIYRTADMPDPARAFYGGTPKDERSDIIDGFQEGRHKFFVGQQHSGGYGLTLTAATVMIYYSNDFSLEARLQSEDRCHRIGQKHNVLYVDLESAGTVDSRILSALLNKKEIADTVVGDDPSTWF
jgi:hypothetical protein